MSCQISSKYELPTGKNPPCHFPKADYKLVMWDLSVRSETSYFTSLECVSTASNHGSRSAGVQTTRTIKGLRETEYPLSGLRETEYPPLLLAGPAPEELAQRGDGLEVTGVI